MQILLVEDDPQTARMVRFYLEREGCPAGSRTQAGSDSGRRLRR
ncbi:MAG: response regulator [Chloroflexota bacterium]